MFADTPEMESDKAKSASRNRASTSQGNGAPARDSGSNGRLSESSVFISPRDTRQTNGEGSEKETPQEESTAEPQLADRLKELKRKRKELKKKILNDGISEKQMSSALSRAPNTARRYEPPHGSDLRLTPEER